MNAPLPLGQGISVPPVRLCTAGGCEEPAVLQWGRLATAAELAGLTLPAGETTVRIAVFGCQTHALDLESAALLHQASCSWPAPCSCTKAGP